MKKEKGFTLIELLITILVMAVVFGVIAFSVVNIIKEGKENANKITYSTIKTTAIEYVKEFKTTSDLWSDELDELNQETGNEFACTTVSQLINKGFLKESLIGSEIIIEQEDGTSLTIDENTMIKVVRDENKVLSSDISLNNTDCINTKPKVTIDVEGPNSNGWYYDKDANNKIKVKINPTSIGVALSEYRYTINGNELYVETNPEIKEFNFSDKVEEENYGENTKICVKVKNNNDVFSDEECITINVDFTEPETPVFTADDNVLSGGWHKENFELKIKIIGGGNSPSGIYYYYGIDENNLETIGDTIKINDSIERTYYAKACNGVGKCSEIVSYVVKLDNVIPSVEIKVEGLYKTLSDGNWYYDKDNTNLTITTDVGISGIASYEYYIVDGNGNNRKEIDATTTDKSLSKSFKEVINEIENATYGKGTKICAKIINNAGNDSKDPCKVINIDFTIPELPIMTATDGVASGGWHNSDFEIKITGGGNSPSGIKYYYGTDSNELENEGNKISVNSAVEATYYAKACNGVGKCSGNSSYEIKADSVVPSVSIEVIGDTKTLSDGNWYYDKANTTLKITPTVGISGIKTYSYYIVDANGNNKKIIETTTNDKSFSGLLNNFINGSAAYGKGTKICATITNNAGKSSTVTCKTINVDFVTPGVPTLTASDNVATNNWHTSSSFTINVSGGTTPSTVTYKYGTSASSLTSTVSNNKISSGITNGKTYYVQACNKVGVCGNTASYIIKIDTTTPSVTVNISGTTKTVSSASWYYDKANTTLKITPTVGTSGIKSYSYYMKNGSNKKNITTSSSDRKYDSLLNNLISGSAIYGKGTQICASITNGAGKKSTETCKTINVDFTTPSVPTISASDNKSSGSWHTSSFTLTITGGGSSPSGNEYKYGTSSTSQTSTGSSISVTSTKTYYAKACNKVGVCSSTTNYSAKIDTTKPSITNVTSKTNSSGNGFTISATIRDTESGIVRYKISKHSSYVSYGWTSRSATTSSLSISQDFDSSGNSDDDNFILAGNKDKDNIVITIPQSNITPLATQQTYYVWAEDDAGNYNSYSISAGLDTEGPVYVSGGVLNAPNGTISTATFTDESTPITVYYLVKTSQSTPSSSSFTSTSKTFAPVCETTYYAYAKAVDALGNYTIKYLGSSYSGDCCTLIDTGAIRCNYYGWLEQEYFNSCTSLYEYVNMGTACMGAYTYCDPNFGACTYPGIQYRNCRYYYGGIEEYTTESQSCYYGGSTGGDYGGSTGGEDYGGNTGGGDYGGNTGGTTTGPKYWDSTSTCANVNYCDPTQFPGGGVCTPVYDYENYQGRCESLGYSYSCQCCEGTGTLWDGSGMCLDTSY